MDTTTQEAPNLLQFVDEWVTVKWVPRTRAHYEALGYAFTCYWTEFQVKPQDLSLGSHVLVNVRCSICGQIRATPFKTSRAVCKRCSDVVDLTGKRFDKLTVISSSNRRRGKNMVWFCQCDCGNYVYKSGSLLQKPVPHNCRRGPCNHRWNEGISREERMFHRGQPYYKEWRESVFKRDNFVCLKCGYAGGKKLVAHHLDSWDSDKEKRFSIDNGATLCKTCHKAFHDAYGYGGNTASQFREWLNSQAGAIVGHNDVHAEATRGNARC